MRVGLFAMGMGGLLSVPALLAASEPRPYVMDPHTLHLWHLDESAPPFMDSGNNRKPLWGLLNGASSGSHSLPGFGASVGFNSTGMATRGGPPPYGPILLAQPKLDVGVLDNVFPPFSISGDDGAFTIEALVRLDVLPANSAGVASDIVTMDDEDKDHRIFLFRIEKPGFLSFVPISGDAVRGGGLATIPTSGPHAMNTKDWFHVAVTYDGNENVPDNLKLYWTRIGAGSGAANPIGRGTLSADLRRELGDFAIGNSGKYNTQGPNEFFPGSIDEVRISSIARDPHDFFFVDPEEKRKAFQSTTAVIPSEDQANLQLHQIFVDDLVKRPPADGESLVIGPGTHRLDFDFGFSSGVMVDPLTVKCRLEGMDEDWRPIARGMTFTWEMLNEYGKVLGRTVFTTTRSSRGWESDVLDSPQIKRTEPLFIPELTAKVRVTMSSGTPDTTGCWMINHLNLSRSTTPGVNLWANGDFRKGERVDQIGGVPAGWRRGGTEPGIARLILSSEPALGLLDAEQNHSAYWTSTQDLPVPPNAGGEAFLLTWDESFNVISGTSLRATYSNVPSGRYTFRAISLTGGESSRTTQLAMPVVIRQPYWKHAWFLPLIAVSAMFLLGWGLLLNYQRRSRNRIAAIKLASAVERDRARIARDMHDDLGTRVSLLKHAASVVRRAIDSEPAKARHQAARLESAASDLVRAMDGLVWAVNPKNDTLEHLAVHLSGVAQEIFRDAAVRLRISIPMDFPEMQLSSDFRHHFSLVVKEALHNILKHAGGCEVSLGLKIENRELVAAISDSGCGFDAEDPRAGNGLSNLVARAAEIHGTCEIRSSPGKGTGIVLRCPLPRIHQLLNS